MVYNQYEPHPLLSGYVKCIWTLESPVQGDHNDLIVPDGCTELIFHFGSRYKRIKDETEVLQPRSFVYGQIRNAITIAPSGETGIISIRFYPWGLTAFSGVPANELSGNETEATHIWGRDASILEDMLADAQHNDKRVWLLNKFLIGKLKSGWVNDPLIAAAVKTINDCNGNIPIHEIIAQLYISERQFERRFLSVVGISARAYSRIVRFQYSIKLAGSGAARSLTELSAACGYYDQAHFIRDFKALSGHTPGQYFSSNHALSDLFTES